MTLESKCEATEILLGMLKKFIDDCMENGKEDTLIENGKLIFSRLDKGFSQLNGTNVSDVIMSFCLIEDSLELMKTMMMDKMALITGLGRTSSN